MAVARAHNPRDAKPVQQLKLRAQPPGGQSVAAPQRDGFEHDRQVIALAHRP